MNKRQKEVALTSLNEEKKIFKALEVTYRQALKDIGEKIKVLQADDTQSKIYQLEYQKSLKKQIENILDVMNDNNYTKIYDFLKTSYNIGYIGSIYDIAGQGIPLIIPIDQKKMVTAIVNESKIKEGLYKTMVSDTKWLKGRISAEVSRGIATNISYNDIARNLDNTAKIGLNRAKRIARTEGHRVTQSATFVAQKEAQKAGADVVKQWDATLDGRTRDTHRLLDGQIREIDEPFEVAGKKAMFPSDFGDPAEDCNCRCVCLQRARWALDEDELATLQERTSFFELDKTKSFEDYKEKYLGIPQQELENYGKDGTLKKRKQIDTGYSGKIPNDKLEEYNKKAFEQIKLDTGYSDEQAKEFHDALLQYFGGDYEKILSSETETAKIIKDGISKMPTYDGSVYRGMIFTNEDVKQFTKLKVGDSVPSKGIISSWSSDERTATSFGGANSYERSTVILECVDNKTGVGVQHISKFGTIEAEVLSSADYEVVEVTLENKHDYLSKHKELLYFYDDLEEEAKAMKENVVCRIKVKEKN